MSVTRVPLPERGWPTDLVERAVAAIRSGKVVVLPTETVYGLVADPSDPAAVDRIRALKGRPADLVFTHHIADRADAEKLAAMVPPRVARLVDRFWPGPLTVVLPARTGGDVGLRVPGHAFARDVIRAMGHSLYLTSVNLNGAPPLVDPDAIAAGFRTGIDLLFDAGKPALEQASTVVRWRPDGALEVLREGTLHRGEVLGAAARRVLFVCSGNTCRSPLAEVMARRAVARRLGVLDDDVLAHGLAFASAGTTAADGVPASEGSRLAAAEIDLDIRAHRSRQLDAALVRGADRIYCLAPAHLVAVRALAADAVDRVELLAPDGAGIPDPFGGDADEYRRTRDAIGRAIDARVDELLQLADAGGPVARG